MRSAAVRSKAGGASARGASARDDAPQSAGGARRGPARSSRAPIAHAEDRFDLLTAALIGAAVGAAAMLLVRRPSPRKLIRPLSELGLAGAGRMAMKAGASALGSRALRHAGQAAAPMARDAAEALGDYVRTARSAIDDFGADEVRDLRKAIRRGRRRAGL